MKKQMFQRFVGLKTSMLCILAFVLACASALAVPDLTYSGTPSANPNPVTTGNSVAINLTIANIGNTNAAASTTKIQIKPQGSTTTTVQGYFATPAINANSSVAQSYSLTIPAGSAAGTYTAYLILDNYNTSGNTNFANDQTNFNFTVSSPSLVPDLAYSGVPSANPNPVTAGNSVAINLTIANIGNGNAAASTTKIQIKPQGSTTTTVQGYFATPAINANSSVAQSYSLTIPAGSAAGTYTAYLILDNYNTSGNTNFANDQTNFNFTVSSAVSAPALSVNPTNATVSATAGSTSFGVSNTGGGTMSYSSSVTSGSSWLSITSGASGGNSGTINVSYSTNTAAQRSGTIQVIATGAAGSPASITVTQAAGSSGSSNNFVGKGDWIHNIDTCIQNVPLTTHSLQSLIDWEQSKGIQYLIVKAGQGDHYYPLSGTKLDATLVQMCHAAGIKVYGWHYPYGGAYDPAWNEDTSVVQEVQIANQMLATGCDGIVIDAELEYEDGQTNYRYRKFGGTLPTAASAADAYCQGILAAYPNAIIAHAPVWKPSSHPGFPYVTFGKYCVAVMPQAYCSAYATTETYLAHEGPAQMIQDLDNAWAIAQNSWISQGYSSSVKQIVPVIYGAAPVTGQEIVDFVNGLKNDANPATAGGYQGVSFYDTDLHTASIWNAMATVTIGSSSPPPPSDTSAPTISVFSVNPNSVTLGQGFTVGYTVSDSGGSHLKQASLWRANVDGTINDSSWIQIGVAVTLSGDSFSGSFPADTPPSAGSYWYGIHVTDNAGNYMNERDAGQGPKQVTVNAALQTGSLQVNITPAGAVNAGAQWQVDSGPFQSSGATVNGLSAGPHPVAFKTVSGWTTPGNQTVTVNANQTSTASGTYVVITSQTGALQVNISPAGAVNAGAQWQVDGGPFQSSGATMSGLSVGPHPVAFKAVSGWTTPGNQTVTVNANQTTIASGTYGPGGAHDTAHDWNGNGGADLLWQNTVSGARAIWFMNGATYAGNASLGIVPTDWQIVGTGDFNGDGKPDIVWQNTKTGAVGIWFMNGATYVSSTTLGVFATDWQIAGIADFNGDGKPDIVWQNINSGARSIWFMDGTTYTGNASLGVVPTDWQIGALGDFNGDGQTDIVWQNTVNGGRGIWFMNGVTWIGNGDLGVVSTDWQIAGTGDFNGDGKPDLVWQNTINGGRGIWFMDGAAHVGDAGLGAVVIEWKIRN
jgi:hypothetical protein